MNEVKDYLFVEQMKKDAEKKLREAELQNKLAMATTRDEVLAAKKMLVSVQTETLASSDANEASASKIGSPKADGSSP